MLTILSNLLRFRQMTGLTVNSAFQSELSEAGSIVFLPEGTHSITASVGGKPKTLAVTVDDRVLAGFTEDLARRQESNVRPFAGFDHKPGAASFIPQAFRYEPGVGLLLDVEWTAAGRAAIEGRDYSYFSPTFLISKDGIPTGLTGRGEIGSLVNDPAFEEIPRIAAAHQATDPMQHLVELGLVEASCAPDQALETAKAALASLREAAAQVETVEAANIAKKSAEDELADMKKRNDELEAAYTALKDEMAAKASASADAAIEDAVKAGRIAPQDEATKAFWRSSITSNPEAVKALNAIPVNPALSGKTVLAGRTEEPPQGPALTGLARVEAAFKAQSQA
jgi:phage I-like protein